MRLQGFLPALWEALRQQLNPVGKDLSGSIREAMDYRPVFDFSIAGHRIAVTEAVISMWITVAILIAVAFILAARIRERPGRRQAFFEWVLEGVVKICRSAGLTEAQTHAILPFVTTVGFFIMVSNLLSVFKLKPPAQNPAFPIVLALLTVVYIVVMTIRFIGFKGFCQAMLYPKASLLPFKVLDLAIKPISLAFRLFGNIFGAYILMEFVSLIIPAFLPGILGLWFDFADGLLQGGIFAYLTVVYIGEFVENQEALLEQRAESAHEKALERERQQRLQETGEL